LQLVWRAIIVSKSTGDKQMTYAVFILVNKSWKLHQVYNNKVCAMQEKKYLIEKIGIIAEVFQK